MVQTRSQTKKDFTMVQTRSKTKKELTTVETRSKSKKRSVSKKTDTKKVHCYMAPWTIDNDAMCIFMIKDYLVRYLARHPQIPDNKCLPLEVNHDAQSEWRELLTKLRLLKWPGKGRLGQHLITMERRKCRTLADKDSVYKVLECCCKREFEEIQEAAD